MLMSTKDYEPQCVTLTKYELADGGAGDGEVLEGAQQMDPRVRQHYARLGHVLYQQLRLPVLPRYATDGTAHVCSL